MTALLTEGDADGREQAASSRALEFIATLAAGTSDAGDVESLAGHATAVNAAAAAAPP